MLLKENYNMKEKIDTIEKKLTSTSIESNKVKEKIDELNKLSYELRKSDPKKALSYGVEAKKISSEISYSKGLGYSLRNMGICLSRLADYDSSIENLSKSIGIFDKLNDKSGKASSLNGMGIVFRKQRDYAKSIKSYSESLQLYRELKDLHGEALSLNNIGVIYARLGDFFKAIRLYNTSLQIYIEIGEKYGEAITQNNIGFAYMNLGDFTQALSSNLKAQKILTQIGSKQGEAETLTNIGLIYNELNEYKEALKYEKRSLHIKEKTNDKRGQSNSFINIGNTYLNLGNPDQALDYLFKSLKIKKEIGDSEGEGNSLTSIAIAYTKKKDFQKANDYLNKSIKLQTEINDKSGEIVSLTTLSSVLIFNKEYDKAISNLEKALKLAEQIKSKDYIYEINKHLSECYKHKGDYKKGLEYFERYYETKNDVFNERSDNKLRNLQVIHQVETAQKEAEIQRLKNVELSHTLSELTAALDVSEIISRTDNNGTITYINENFCIISGYSADELIGKNHRIIKSGFHSKEFYSEMWNTIKNKKVWKGEIKNKSKSGEIYWVDTTIVPLLDDKKNLIEFLAITTNITKRRQAEEKLKRQFVELEKTNSELDKFVYSTSHDLRAPLTSILGIIGLSKMDTEDKQQLEYLDMMERSINRLDGCVIDIINYSRNTRLEVQKEKIDFNLLISETLENLKYIEGAEKIETKININETTSFYSDKSRLRVIFNNLISNAIRYHIPTHEHPFVNIHVSIFEDKVVIQVKDNGMGINAKHIPEIFDMFFKISKKSLGSGLGLYIAKETVNKLNGEIKVESELDEGSTFTIEIPNK